MAFCLVVGTNEFKSQLQGYENVQAQCANCGNWRTQCITRWPWFTICFLPVIPLATHKYKELVCHTCNFHQDLKYRTDIQPRGEGQPMQPYGNQGPQSQQQGWNGGGGGGGPGGPGGQGAYQQQQQQQQQGGRPVYK